MSSKKRDFWRDRAACISWVNAGKDFWFGSGDRALTAREVNKAQNICAVCPVKTQCLNLALSISPKPYGVWAGMRF